MVALNALGYALIDWRRPSLVQVVEISFLIFLGYLVLWFYWRGQNWARVLVFLTSILCFFNLWPLLKGRTVVNGTGKLMIYWEAALAAFLLVWLYSKSANRFSQTPKVTKPIGIPSSARNDNRYLSGYAILTRVR